MMDDSGSSSLTPTDNIWKKLKDWNTMHYLKTTKTR
jgi:hypothetical protein